MKKIVILSIVLFTLLSCKQNVGNRNREVTITIEVDAGVAMSKDGNFIKAKTGVFWKEIKTIAASKIKAKKEYVFLEWRLKNEKGKPLSDDVAFNKDEVIYAVSKQVENKACIHIIGDERVSISGKAFIELDILTPKTFKDVEAKIKEKLSLKPEWNNGDYDFFDWKLNDENGKLIFEDTPISKQMTVFARTNYIKFKIENSTTITGYEGEEPRGRIIIPKEIIEIGNEEDCSPFAACSKLTDIDMSLCKDLKLLQLSFSYIKSIDISNNPKLSYLGLNSTKVKNMDISNNPELKILNLCEIEIESVDTSHNPKLEVIDLHNTGITSIDLSHNPKLKKLSLYETGITDIDISHNPKLEILYLRGTKITSIDFSHNPDISDVDFRNCPDLVTIDLSICKKLVSLETYNFRGAIKAIVTLPSSLKDIQMGSFGNSEANYCKRVIVPNDEIKQLVILSDYPAMRIEVKP